MTNLNFMFYCERRTEWKMAKLQRKEEAGFLWLTNHTFILRPGGLPTGRPAASHIVLMSSLPLQERCKWEELWLGRYLTIPGSSPVDNMFTVCLIISLARWVRLFTCFFSAYSCKMKHIWLKLIIVCIGLYAAISRGHSAALFQYYRHIFLGGNAVPAPNEAKFNQESYFSLPYSLFFIFIFPPPTQSAAEGI